MWTMGLPSSLVLSAPRDGLWRGWAGPWTVKRTTSPDVTPVARLNTQRPDMSTNRRSYPHRRTPYPHPDRPRMAAVARKRNDRAGSVRVQELAKGPDVPPEVVVIGHLSLDLLAAV